MLTNIIENMMTYSDEKAWLPGQQKRYADRGDVRNYIDRYIGRHLQNPTVKLVTNTAVEDVQRVLNQDKQIPYEYLLTLRHLLQDSTEEWYQQKFDAVVVATGHYHVPFIPATPGLGKVQEQWPSVVQHAKYYRDLAPYKGKTVVVVGARALGADLTKYAADTASKVYQLIREVTLQQRKTRRPNVEMKPGIRGIELKDSGFSVVFDDGSEVQNPDHIVYATGYQFLFPFLRREYGDIARNGLILPSLYQHTFSSTSRFWSFWVYPQTPFRSGLSSTRLFWPPGTFPAESACLKEKNSFYGRRNGFRRKENAGRITLSEPQMLLSI